MTANLQITTAKHGSMNGQQHSEGALLVRTAIQTPCHRVQPSVQVPTAAMESEPSKGRVLASIQHTGNEASSKQKQLCCVYCVIPKLAIAGTWHSQAPTPLHSPDPAGLQQTAPAAAVHQPS